MTTLNLTDSIDQKMTPIQEAAPSGVAVENLSKSFGRHIAVDSITFEIPTGKSLTLLGPSGCGKTTTLRMIAGLETPDKGVIVVGAMTVFSSKVNVLPEQRGLGMVFQSYAIWPHMTVAENVAFPLRVQRWSKNKIKERVSETLALVQMSRYAKRYPSQLSGGQQQRVALARALAPNPKLLLLDEPLSNLDAKLREEMRFELRTLQQDLSITSVYVTHDQAEAFAVSDYVAVMQDGILLQLDTPQNLFTHPRTTSIAEFLGWTNIIPVRRQEGGQVEVLGRELWLGITESTKVSALASIEAVGVRPEKISIISANNPPISDAIPWWWRAKILTSVFLGTHYEYKVAVKATKLTIRSVQDIPKSVDKIWIGIPINSLQPLESSAKE